MANPEDGEARISKLWAMSVPQEYRPGRKPTERGPASNVAAAGASQ